MDATLSNTMVSSALGSSIATITEDDSAQPKINSLLLRSTDTLAYMWSQKVNLYTKTKFRYMSDTLVALSGVGKWF